MGAETAEAATLGDEIPVLPARIATIVEALTLWSRMTGARSALVVLEDDPNGARGGPAAGASAPAAAIVVGLPHESGISDPQHGSSLGLRPRIITLVRSLFEGHPPGLRSVDGWHALPWSAAGRRGAVLVEHGAAHAEAMAAWAERALARTSPAEEVLAALGEGIVVADPDGTVRSATEVAGELLGVPAAALIGRALQDVCGGPAATRLDRVEPAEVIVTHFVGAAGAALTARSERGAGGAIVVHLAPVGASAARAVRRDQWLGGLRHEVRTPLTVLRGVTAMLEEEPDMDLADRVGFLASLRRETHRVITFVEDLLTYVRLDTGRAPIRPQPVDLVGWAMELAAELRPFCDEQGITLRCTTHERTVFIEADRSLLDQLGKSLLGHVLRVAPRHAAVTLSVSAAPDHASLAVEDDGPPLAAADLRDVYTTFRRSTATGKYAPGVGVGVALAKRIADSHGWGLTHTSIPGMNRLELRAPLARDTP